MREYGGAQERERVAQRLLLAGGAAAIVALRAHRCASPSWPPGSRAVTWRRASSGRSRELARILRARPGVPIEGAGAWPRRAAVAAVAVMVCSATWEGRPATLCLFSPPISWPLPCPAVHRYPAIGHRQPADQPLRRRRVSRANRSAGGAPRAARSRPGRRAPHGKRAQLGGADGLRRAAGDARQHLLQRQAQLQELFGCGQ